MLILAKKFEVKAFENIEAMNIIVDAFKQRIRGILPSSVLKVVDFISSHSCKVRGVSWATYDYIKDKTGLSLSTLKRAVKLLSKLGFIQVIRTWVGGRQSANIIQIQHNIDWSAVEAELMGRFRVEYADTKQTETEVVPEQSGSTFSLSDDTVNDTDEDRPTDTLSAKAEEAAMAEKPCDDADLWNAPDYISEGEAFPCLSNSFIKNIDNIDRKRGFASFFDWLEE